MKEIKNNNLIGVTGDLHARDFLGYSDYISDRREGEKKAVLDCIVDSFKDCEHVVLLGDIFHQKNNSSETNRWVIEFLERFGNKHIYMISGNHCTKGNGKTAIDFIKEIKKDNWHVFTKPTQETIGELKVSFLPYMMNSELEVETYEESTKAIMKQLSGGDILFAHHAISGTTFNGIKTDLLKEVVLPKDELEKKYKLVVAGHIHEPQQVNNVLIAGSIFTNEVGEHEKFVWKLKSDLSIEKILLPNRKIYKIEDPTTEVLNGIKTDSIVKVVVTKTGTDIEALKKELAKFDAFLLIENYPNTRKKMHIDEGAMDFSVESLLKLYSKERKVDLAKLLKGLEIIND